MSVGPRAFTFSSGGRLLELGTDVGIRSHRGESNQPLLVCQAIWDTGATRSFIPSQTIRTLDLKPVGVEPVRGFDGKPKICNTYLVDIALPNKFIVPGVRVAGGLDMVGEEVLIGMDIIGLGDFAVTNLKNKTCFTFRMPSMVKLDFEKDIRQENTKKQKLSSRVRSKRKTERKNKKSGRRPK